VWSNWKLKAFTYSMVIFSFTCMCINSQYLMWWGYEGTPQLPGPRYLEMLHFLRRFLFIPACQ
jgi:hypothetical protein